MPTYRFLWVVRILPTERSKAGWTPPCSNVAEQKMEYAEVNVKQGVYDATVYQNKRLVNNNGSIG